jgi:phosphoribosylamine--glycine ligase
MVKPAVIGKDGRSSALIAAFRKSPRVKGDVPRLSAGKKRSDGDIVQDVLAAAREHKPDFVFVGPEEPLALGVADALQTTLGIPCIGPTSKLAQLESSKAFTRDLLRRHGIPGNPEYRVFRSRDGIEQYCRELGEFVVKPDGLTGGKGVKVSGTHLQSAREADEYAAELFRTHGAVVIEERLDGEEFSFQSFCDGSHVADMVVVQDHKRAFDGDLGPNTGGMGSYSCPDHRLPFLTDEHRRAASAINAAVATAIAQDTGEKYRGILYGGFMLTRQGVRLLEYNARFGDPEALNVLSLLKTDLVDICEAIIRGTLDQLSVEFASLATVCKYVVPQGYPDHPVTNERISLARVPDESERLRYYFAAVEETSDGLYLTGSRAIGFVGIGADLDQAESIAEEAASAVDGPVYHRKDIGTRALIQQRCDHVRRILGA